MTRDRRTPGTRRFPCSQCGAQLRFAPGSDALTCEHCGHTTEIQATAELIREYDFREALQQLATASPADALPATRCENCAAQFEFDQHVHSGECPFCGTQIVRGTGADKHIKPKSLLPFLIDEPAAREHYQEWVAGLWFAPGKLKRYARDDQRLTGVYVPYWTYDSHTRSSYTGQRGDAYTVSQSYTVVVNGRRERRTRQVTKIRWTPVRGQVARNFDDVLVGASRSLPRKITSRLAPWDLDSLVPYNEEYLSGFRSEIYQVALDEGFDLAVKIMDRVIRRDVCRDIGGDQQRITNLHTSHSETRYKHLLLPVWSAGFRYRSKVFRFVINGRTGKVQGERPYSYLKIALAVLLGLAAAAALVVALDESGALKELMWQLG